MNTKSTALNSCDIDKTYYILSAFFLIFFYAIPLIMVYNKSVLSYGENSFTISEEDKIRALFSLFIFVLGFAIVDLIKYFRSEKKYPLIKPEKESSKNFRINLFFYILSTLYVLYFFNSLLNPLYGQYIADVRQGIIERSKLEYATYNFFALSKFILFFAALQARKRKIALLIILMAAYGELVTSSGRTNLLLNIILISIVLFNQSALKTSLAFIALSTFLIPFAINLKTIIYLFSTGENWELALIESFTNINTDEYLENFGHPLFSILKINDLLNGFGYRFFYDYPQGILHYLKLLGFDPGYSITYYNTKNLLGFMESVVPPSHIAFGFMQLSYIGVFVSGIIYRLFGIYTKTLIVNYNLNIESLKFFFLFLAANTFYHGDFRIMAMTFFAPTLLISKSIQISTK